MLTSYSGMSHLLAQKRGEMKAAQAGAPPVTSAAASAPGDKNSVKGNLNMSVDIINNCFNLDAPKSVQKIGLFKL